jgi:hypothetical protein
MKTVINYLVAAPLLALAAVFCVIGKVERLET